jgi:hypothetical protein
MVVILKDETFTGKVLNELQVEFLNETVTVKDIITLRVHNEVDTYNKKAQGFFNGLVEPTDAEKTINGYKLKSKRIIDAEKQTYIALDAFMNNGYFLLIDNIQSESLEQKVHLKSNTAISFIKLTPLVGG